MKTANIGMTHFSQKIRMLLENFLMIGYLRHFVLLPTVHSHLSNVQYLHGCKIKKIIEKHHVQKGILLSRLS